ncbi:helix-turn-helix domain-containing protein [Microbispora sp. NBC_01389]|uniref:helix-turn-helix domain-containing protein n=1 Tax=Microbispora sp. NBC_01389 TaxID=2903584 RepID=UPI00324EF0D5
MSGHVLKLLREAVGMTQERFAEALGVSVAAVQGWESGRRPLAAMSAGEFSALRFTLLRLRAPQRLLDALTLAINADQFIGDALTSRPGEVQADAHLLGSWVVSRPFTGLIVWPLAAIPPDDFPDASSRRGPTPAGPTLSAEERRHLSQHLQAAAERADRRSEAGLLLARQTYYLLGFGSSAETAAWLVERYRKDRRIVRSERGWSAAWPLARSTASALTRLGDPEPMRAFIAERLGDDVSETANLNYWAFWTGELSGDRLSDSFMAEDPITAWRGDRLIRHLLDRLTGELGFIELNIHTLWALVLARPDLLTPERIRGELKNHIERLLDENVVAPRARQELEALRYGVAIATR